MADATLEAPRSASALGPRRLRQGLAIIWQALPPAGRFALAGVLASALVAVALGIFIPLEIRRHLMVAEGRGLDAAVQALRPSLPDLRQGPPGRDEIARLDRLVGRTLLDSDHVRVKLWSLDGQIIYSDAGGAIGLSYPDVVPRLREAEAHGVIAEVSDLRDPENASEQGHSQLVEYYVPVRDDEGRTTAVFEIYTDVRFLEEALAGITAATWLAIGTGLTLLMLFLGFLVLVTVRSIKQDRAAAEARAAELSVLVDAAGALVSSLEPTEFLGRLEARVRRTLGLSHFAVEPARPEAPDVIGFPLRDGSWLVGGRSGPPLTEEDARILRSVANNLDAALANAALYAEVRDAAEARRALLRRVVEAHEDERHQIVGELHDSLAAELIRVLYGVRGVASRRASLPAEIAEEIEVLEQLVTRTESDLRAFMSRLRPGTLDELGLRAALEATTDRFGRETHLTAEIHVAGDPGSLSRETQLMLLRAAEEALLNVRKHAAATRARLTLRVTARHARMIVEDDGAGWPIASAPGEPGRTLGLAYLRERSASLGGTLRTDRSRLGGARLVLDIPVGI